MSTQPMRPGRPRAAPVAGVPDVPRVFETYEEAQRAVDYLSDQEFPVQNCLIVGTDLKQLERVTGRLTCGRVWSPAPSPGMWLGLFVGTIFALFDPSGFNVLPIIATVAFGAVFGSIWAMVGYALTQGQRDFTSVSQVVAAKYEVLCEHKHVQRGRELLAQMDPMRAAQEEVRQPRGGADPARRASSTEDPPPASQPGSQPAPYPAPGQQPPPT